MRIRPFRALRYDLEKVGDLSKVVAPPYDQIDPTTQSLLYAMHPENIVRISFGREEPGDDGHRNRYERARGFLERWLGEGVLVEDPAPAIYPYHSTYRLGGEWVTRKGFIAMGELSEYADGVVLPHERTHTKPKEDRLRLLEATRADLGLVFMLHPDPDRRLETALSEVTSGPSFAEAVDLRGEQHRVWRVADPRIIEAVQKVMADRQVIIADGHHRYETALEFRRGHPEAAGKLMAFFSLDGPGLTIFPLHRLVRDIADFRWEALRQRVAPAFEVQDLAELGSRASAEGLAHALSVRFTGRERFPVLVAGAPHPSLLSLRPGAFERIAWPKGTSRGWRGLAVSLLHEGILRPHLGIDDEALRLASHVDYTASAEEAVRSVQERRYQAGFLLPPVSPAELQAVVEAGDLMPQKSTHFYPKLLTGLVMARVG